ncbi:respiratory nitrate reductase subunit gamma [Desulfofundulus sp.]|uniref:respiratory nitrate reductase subunit gamma n=1 Tax=Desulfofundulus sp. TaxID=2282750 RepID=UPI003C7493C7
MDWPAQLLWLIYPYVVLTIFIVGSVYRYNTDQYGWTSRSSEILEKQILKWGSTLFHWGIVFVLLGHFGGLLIPLYVHRWLGISDELYHLVAAVAGGTAGLVACGGVIVLLLRRLNVTRVRVNSNTGDMVAILLLVIVVLSGMSGTCWNALHHFPFEYRTTVGPWLRGILLLHPDPSLMKGIPVIFKIHVAAILSFLAVWPFTRLVHVFSLPIIYLFRSPVIYRRRAPEIMN